ncbi:MAG: hypothetical protein HYX74_04535 [Acidobacteria bacterium]|nr:hypothetical protein [Acidobacteriota bacterium]
MTDPNQQPGGDNLKENLKAQAALLRQALYEASGQPRGRRRALGRAIPVAVMAAVTAVAVGLLVSREARDALWSHWVKEDPAAQASTITLRNLPPEPPAMPHVIVGKDRVSPAAPSQTAPSREAVPRSREAVAPSRGAERAPEPPAAATSSTPPVLERQPADKAEEPAPPPAAMPEPEAPAAPQVSEGTARAAYDLVLATQSRMRDLVSQGTSNWRVVKEKNGVVWIDIVIAGGREQHYIWAVDVEKRTVEALSQAARNLEG